MESPAGSRCEAKSVRGGPSSGLISLSIGPVRASGISGHQERPGKEPRLILYPDERHPAT